MTAPDEVMTRVGEGLALSQQGRIGEARELLEAVWAQVGPDGDPLHRVAVAHHLADLQDEPHAELEWDLRALAATDELTDDRAAAGGVAAVAALHPSLHLNLGDVYLRLGDHAAARRHADAGDAAAHALPDGGYGAMVRGGLQRLRHRLDTTG